MVVNNHSNVTGLLVHLVSGLLLRRLGYDLLISLTFTLYSLRLFGYSLVKESHHLFLCEMLKPFGNSLAMTLGSHYVSANTNGDDTATLEVGNFKSPYSRHPISILEMNDTISNRCL